MQSGSQKKSGRIGMNSSAGWKKKKRIPFQYLKYFLLSYIL